MSFFDRLEAVYLNILRVVILILATLFLAGAVFATVTAARKIIPDVHHEDARKLVTGDSLRDFRSAQSGAPASDVAADQAAASASGAQKIDDRIQKAAASLVSYLRSAKSMDVGQGPVEQMLSEKQLGLPETLQGDYADSLVKLTDSLARSRDPNLDVDALLQWHYAKFEAAKDQAAAAETAREAKNAVNMQEAMVIGGAALSAFLLFLIVVFGFVLVKIERNLRKVHVVLPDGPTSTVMKAA